MLAYIPSPRVIGRPSFHLPPQRGGARRGAAAAGPLPSCAALSAVPCPAGQLLGAGSRGCSCTAAAVGGRGSWHAGCADGRVQRAAAATARGWAGGCGARGGERGGLHKCMCSMCGIAWLQPAPALPAFVLLMLACLQQLPCAALQCLHQRYACCPCHAHARRCGKLCGRCGTRRGRWRARRLSQTCWRCRQGSCRSCGAASGPPDPRPGEALLGSISVCCMQWPAHHPCMLSTRPVWPPVPLPPLQRLKELSPAEALAAVVKFGTRTAIDLAAKV